MPVSVPPMSVHRVTYEPEMVSATTFTIGCPVDRSRRNGLLKEVIQPQVPLRLPCYDFTPVMNHTVVSEPLAVILPTSGTTHSHGVTGGVYKARERIHRGMLIRDY